MKNNLIFILVFVFSISVNASRTKFFIVTEGSGDENGKLAQTYLDYFESEVLNTLKKEFPCADINSRSAIAALLEHERYKQLFTNDEYPLENIGAAMGCDYLISLRVKVLQQKAIIVAVCLDVRKSNAVARTSLTVAHGDEGLNAVESVSKQIVEELKKLEICPFTGPVNVQISTNRYDKNTEEFPVYCNESDQVYRKVSTINKKSNAIWNFEKKSKQSATGKVTYNLFEEDIIDEQNGCYKCQSGREGGRTYYEKITKVTEISGLSNESTVEGKAVDDARIKIIFNDDGNYFIQIKATSKEGYMKISKDVRAEGTCDNINKPLEKIDKKSDVPLEEIFGPYSGTARDKSLSQKQTIEKEDPVTKEKSTIIINFNLTRE
jgi:hypothetical protein